MPAANQKTLLFKPLLLSAVLSGLVFPAMAAVDNSWETREYFRGAFLDVINASEAYALGYTGKGVVLGQTDDVVNARHREFIGQLENYPFLDRNNLPIEIDFSELDHGSHVAGIIAAKRDGLGMHGVAFESRLAAMGVWPAVSPSNAERFLADDRIRAVNCSWGYDVFPLEVTSSPDEARDYWRKKLRKFVEVQDTYALIAEDMATNDRLFVWALGNAGRGPSCEPLIPYFMPEVRNSISVTALDSAGVVKDGRDIVELRPSAMTWFTSHPGFETALTNVTAPGEDIISVAAETDNKYRYMDGTSMAAPVVTGVAGLVAQAFPWMSARHLADSILTTADKDLTLPDRFVHVYTPDATIPEGEEDDGLVFYIRTSGERGSLTELTDLGTYTKEELRTVIEEQYVGEYDEGIREVFLGWLEEIYAAPEDPDRRKIFIRTFVDNEEIIGQGIVDAGAAVRGIGRLDANRLDRTAVRTMRLADGNDFTSAVDVFDTKGFEAVFSNDITERRWDDKYHFENFRTSSSSGENGDATALNGLAVGLEKRGEGRLYLTGNNTYEGATIVSGGVLSITREDGKPDSGTLVNSCVWVNTGGTLGGNGIVLRDVVNAGTVAPGNSIGTLTVGTFLQKPDATLSIEFNRAGEQDYLKVTDHGTLAGKLQFVPVRDYYRTGTTVALDRPIRGEGSLEGAFDAITGENVLPTLGFGVVETPDGYTLTAQRDADAYAQYAPNRSAAALGRTLNAIAAHAEGEMADMVTALDFSDKAGVTIGEALRTLTPEVHDMAVTAETDGLDALSRRAIHETLRVRDEDEKRDGLSVSFLGNVTHRNEYEGFTGWRAKTAGVEAAKAFRWNESLTGAWRFTALDRESEMSDGMIGRAETTGAYAGASLRWTPVNGTGTVVFGDLRLGVTDNTLKRTVFAAGDAEQLRADWTGVSGRFLLGAAHARQAGGWSIGPVFWTALDLVHRPKTDEEGGRLALSLESQTYDSLSTQVGFHAGSTAVKGEARFFADFLLTRRDRWTGDTVHTDAAFLMAPADGWRTSTESLARDGFVLDGSLGFTNGRLSLECSASAEFFDSGRNDAEANLTVGWHF